MCFPDPCASHARSFYEEKFVTPYFPPIPLLNVPVLHVTYAMLLIITPTHAPNMFDLRVEIKNKIETGLYSMKHMMSNIFN